MSFVPITTGGTTAAAAAAVAARKRQEEEEMTEYSSQELQEGWEFKIVRSATGAFRKPEVLRRACQEEARAGWVLLEKFDDNRIRFKRPTQERAGDRALQQDAYRTSYGLGEGGLVMVVLAVIAAGLLVALGAYFTVR